MTLNPVVAEVCQRIRSRSAVGRNAYLARINTAAAQGRGDGSMGCANVAHAYAALPTNDKLRVVSKRALNLGIVTAYNDMLSAHAPFAGYPKVIKDEARRQGAVAQVAGGVPAMCDGITQGTAGMELSLFSRDVIAMSTAVALSHGVYDAALMLGVCDKIVPGLLIGALHFGHLPAIFVPAGPMASGLPNRQKAKVRELAALGVVGRDDLLDAESRAYHSPGTCTFYGTANSNQMLLEAMGLHVPGTAFVAPGEAAREELTRESVRTVLALTAERRYTPIGEMVDERAIVNAMVALLATGGSTNHLIHWVAVAKSAGIVIDWDDFDALSTVTPLLARVYPNGEADVNEFHCAGGTAFVIRELLDAGLLYEDALTVRPEGLREYTRIPMFADEKLHWRDCGTSGNESVLRPASAPFSPNGGLRLLTGNLGRAVIKTSAVPANRHFIEAPARVFASQEEFQRAFRAGELDRDVVCVLLWQGPRANGMPELHKLTPALGALQAKGFRVALVTDGRMSGASGNVLAAIHVTPESAMGGPLAKIRNGDVVRVDALAGQLQSLVSDDEWEARIADTMPVSLVEEGSFGTGRELYGAFRRTAASAEEGACTWL